MIFERFWEVLKKFWGHLRGILREVFSRCGKMYSAISGLLSITHLTIAAFGACTMLHAELCVFVSRGQGRIGTSYSTRRTAWGVP